jgi:RNA-directed DNA polymerase
MGMRMLSKTGYVDASTRESEVPLGLAAARNTPVWTDRMMAALDRRVEGGWFSLMDKVTAMNTLWRGWDRVRGNAGAAGVDRVSVERFARTAQTRLMRLQESLSTGRYRPDAVRRVEIPKGDGKTRPLGIPTVTDRVVQAAVLEVIEPIFEHQFEARSYGFRPGRSCKDALREVDHWLQAGYVHVVDADLKSYFDSIDHSRLRQLLHLRIKDGSVLDLIDQFLHQQVISESGCWQPEEGTPQGAVLSPLLANVYLHPLDQQMRESGHVMVRYADDFVVLCRDADTAHAALAQIQAWVDRAKLTLHPDKTRIADLSQDGGNFDFLGYRFVQHQGQLRRRIKPKKMTALKAAIRALTPRKRGVATKVIVEQLNRMLKGVYAYFQHVSAVLTARGWQSDLSILDGRVRFRLRRILGKRQCKAQSGRSITAHQRWTNALLQSLGLYSMQAAQTANRHSRSRHT